MSIYDSFAQFLTDLLGSTASLTTQGQIFITYGAYFLCAFLFVAMCRIVYKLIGGIVCS